MFGNNLRRLRVAAGITQESLAEASGLDRSYVGGVERGERNPTLTAILQLASALKTAPSNLFDGIAEEPTLTATETGHRLTIKFKYDQYDATYQLPLATRAEFDAIIGVLKNGLAYMGNKADAVAGAFLHAVKAWPHANPSDVWNFVINRAYCDRTIHPLRSAQLNLEQSWKRTSGWALERVLIAHYASVLRETGITIGSSTTAQKSRLMGAIKDPRIVPDKADVMLSYILNGREYLLGVIHVKASIAERRTDDVPMSQALVEAGYLSIFWTMDSKSYPSSQPVNRGEFGSVDSQQSSDKRRDFEEHGHFSACFSYNANTLPTSDIGNARARIFVCNFKDPIDHFSEFLIEELHKRLA